MLKKFTYNFLIALEAMTQNKLRAFLTSLGIVFGVASVIAMLAIGRGAQQEILEQLSLLGANNIIIKPNVDQEEGRLTVDDDTKAEAQRFSPGLTLADGKSIAEFVPYVERVNPEIVFETLIVRSGLKRSSKLVGVGSHHFGDAGFTLAEGSYFSELHETNYSKVCVIGYDIRSKFFPGENPIGKKIKCGRVWLTVIGVLKKRSISQRSIARLGIRNYNLDIYTPISTFLLRYRNRAVVADDDLDRSSGRRGRRSENNQEQTGNSERRNYHQLDRLVVRVAESKYSNTAAAILSRMLERRHNNVVDFEIIVPEALLAQERRTRAILNIVLGSIASISLIVGGIGIMNIMLASVMERIKEIGIRLSLGATPRDIVLQFLSEAMAISVGGGVVGITLGVALSLGIEYFAGILTLISPFAVLISFGVALSIGLIFGIIPARRAAAQDPVVSLRYE